MNDHTTSSLELSLIKLNKEKLDAWQREYDDLPTGSLYVNSNRGKYQFLHVVDGNRHGINHDFELVYKLARKRYLKALISEGQEALDHICREIKSSGPQKKIREKHAGSSALVLARFQKAGLDTVRISRSPKQHKWSKESYQTNPYEMPVTTYESPGGVVLRSKSEQSIAKALEEHGIPYKYEPAVKLDVSWMEGAGGLISGRFKYYYPDFVIMGRNGDFFLWEHLGRTDLEKYRTHTMEKLTAYRQCGLVDNSHLILTFEKDLEKPDTLLTLLADRILPYV